MELVLRAYDNLAVRRAESLPVRQLWTLLESGGLWDVSKVRAGLDEKPDVYARETIVARLESLVQEGYGEASLRHLRGGEPPDLATLRRRHWPAIDEVEAVQLREDFVRYLTYGLWQAPEELVAHALGVLTGKSDTTFLVGGIRATEGLQGVLDVVEDEHAFAAKFGGAVQAALARAGSVSDGDAVERELVNFGQLLGPLRRLLRGAHDAGLSVIAYQDEPGGEGLARYLESEMEPAHARPEPRPGDALPADGGAEHSNGRAGDRI
jgi:hypothetical protein